MICVRLFLDPPFGSYMQRFVCYSSQDKVISFLSAHCFGRRINLAAIKLQRAALMN